jgi:hypothetical protein
VDRTTATSGRLRVKRGQERADTKRLERSIGELSSPRSSAACSCWATSPKHARAPASAAWSAGAASRPIRAGSSWPGGRSTGQSSMRTAARPRYVSTRSDPGASRDRRTNGCRKGRGRRRRSARRRKLRFVGPASKSVWNDRDDFATTASAHPRCARPESTHARRAPGGRASSSCPVC